MTSTTEQGPTTPDSVRLALPAEAGAIAGVQRRQWQHGLPPEVADHLLEQTGQEQMAQVWHQAITRPPEARFRVLVATEAGSPNAPGPVVGFATTVPSPDADADPASDGMIEEFVIDPPALRRGHGSRLLNACVDTLRADGFARATCWVASQDDLTRAFLESAGWASDGGHRELGDDEGRVRIKQVRLHTAIS